MIGKGKFILIILSIVFCSLFAEEMEEKCKKELKTKTKPKDVILISYSVGEGVIYPAFHYKNGKFTETEFISPDVKKLHEILTGKVYNVFAESNYFPMGRDRCVSFARTKKKVKEFSLFATEKLKFRKPTKKEIEFFNSVNKKCIIMGDPIKPVPCTKPTVLAVSDLNENGFLEFWLKDPYMWNFGLEVVEQTKDKKGLKVLESACFICD